MKPKLLFIIALLSSFFIGFAINEFTNTRARKMMTLKELLVLAASSLRVSYGSPLTNIVIKL